MAPGELDGDHLESRRLDSVLSGVEGANPQLMSEGVHQVGFLDVPPSAEDAAQPLAGPELLQEGLLEVLGLQDPFSEEKIAEFL